uniref:Uncharacterized protein n=1 Tax=Hemiselmis tepida TaxID=464990 RepID=A0A7S0VQF4_9CRYP|mmetsp:Transcript_22811/g.57697  ORF Transcript_22811/g.57697 Transcript_22811/m.57697 type:complete len:309 (+) Transcript_22811:115-1041(+)
MLLVYLKNKNFIGFKENELLEKKNKNILFQEKIEKENIKKILNFKKNEILYYTEEGNFKILELLGKNKKVLIKTPDFLLKDFEIYGDSHVFGLLDKTILTWKKINSKSWKIFAKISTKEKLDKIFILERSNLMITTSYHYNKIKLWSFLDERILFCGQSSLEEKIASIATERSKNYFAIGTLSGKLYLYNQNGILLNIMEHSKIHKKNFSRSKFFPLQFFDENTLFCGGNGHQILKWDLRIGKTVQYWNGHAGEIEHIVSPEKKNNSNSFYLLTADNKGVMKKWDIRFKKELFSYKFPSNQVLSLNIN